MAKNTVEVIIDGKIYYLSGGESEAYMQQVAAYLSRKAAELRKGMSSYSKYDDATRALVLQLNICDDLFTVRRELDSLKSEVEEKERENYSARHDLINTQLKLERCLKQLEQVQRELLQVKAKVEVHE